MSNILIFGNSGSGKSMLAKSICKAHGLARLDLDSVAWEASSPPVRKNLKESIKEILNFISTHNAWVIEGGYSDLLKVAEPYSNEIIFMNLPIDACILNAKSRPWEPHKYESRQAQDENLEMLIQWITQYTERNDSFSLTAHQKFYNHYRGKKRIVIRNVTYA